MCFADSANVYLYICVVSKVRRVEPVVSDYRRYIPILLLCAVFFAACNPARRIADNEFLLRKNKIKAQVARIDNYDLEEIIKQKPNRRILSLVRFHLAVHNIANNGKDTRFRNWLMNTIGEAPVILDSMMIENSVSQISLYLEKKGYFNNEVDYEVKLVRPKEAVVTYSINGNEPHYIRKLTFEIEDDAIRKLYNDLRGKDNIAKGDVFDIEQLETERRFLTDALRNRGYYFFNKEYITFEVDTSPSKNLLDIVMRVKKVSRKLDEFGDETEEVPHEKFRFGKIFINTQYQPRQSPLQEMDTLSFRDYFLLYNNEMEINPKLIANSLFIHPNQIYQADKVEQSYRKLSDLGVYRSVNFKFELSDDDPNSLDCFIFLSPAKKQSVSAETGWSNTGGNQGIALTLNYGNKNSFKGAELFQASLYGGLEVQTTLLTNENDEIIESIPFNTVEVGPQVSLFIPKFLLPIDQDKFSKSSNAKTVLTSSYNYQRRPDYTRTIADIKLQYRWRENIFKTHQIGVADISFIKIDKSAAFEQRLIELNDRFLQTSYTDHLIPATHYTFTYNSQRNATQRNVLFYKGNLELAGNLLRTISKAAGAQQDVNGDYNLFGIRFAQFVKIDNELRHYHRFNIHRTMAYRFMAGVGLPLANLEVLPFEKSFFAGGANDMRAWQARSLGPGSYLDFENRFDKIGDVRLEGSMEYRFGLKSLLEGAAFVDAGNVWLLNPDSLRPGGHFDPSRFAREIAIGGGFGMRFDFTFFIVRLDAGLQVKDPALPEGERWIFQPKDIYNEAAAEFHKLNGTEFTSYRPRINFNLGIGYPF